MMCENSVSQDSGERGRPPVTFALHAEIDKLIEPYNSTVWPGCAVAMTELIAGMPKLPVKNYVGGS